MTLSLGQRWAREENKAANNASDRALESSQSSQTSNASVRVLWRERWMHKGRGSQARQTDLYELICFLFSSSPSPFFCLSLLRDDSHLLCPDTTISHQKHTVTLMSPKLFCVRSLHCLHLLFGVQDLNAVIKRMPITQHRLMKPSHPPTIHWCLDGIMGFRVPQPAGNTISDSVIDSSLSERWSLWEPRQSIHQLTSAT